MIQSFSNMLPDDVTELAQNPEQRNAIQISQTDWTQVCQLQQ
jgi:hypothetical protein